MGRTRLVESLESRQMLSVTTNVTSKGTLVITGTSAADDITVRAGNGFYVVADNATQQSRVFRGDGVVKRLQIDLQGGDDKVRIDASVKKPAVVTGGNGNDRLVSESANVTLSGGNGNDYLLVQLPESAGTIAQRREPSPTRTLRDTNAFASLFTKQAIYSVSSAPQKPAGPRGEIPNQPFTLRFTRSVSGGPSLVGGPGDDTLESNASGTLADGGQGADTGVVRDRVILAGLDRSALPQNPGEFLLGSVSFGSVEVTTKPLGDSQLVFSWFDTRDTAYQYVGWGALAAD